MQVKMRTFFGNKDSKIL